MAADRVSRYGPLITKQQAADLGVLETATGFEKKEDGSWQALTPADTPKEQSGTAVPAPSQVTYKNIRVEEKDGVVTTIDPKGNRQTFGDGQSCMNYLCGVLG